MIWMNDQIWIFNLLKKKSIRRRRENVRNCRSRKKDMTRNREKKEKKTFDRGCGWFIPPWFPSNETLFANTYYTTYKALDILRCHYPPPQSPRASARRQPRRCSWCRFARQFRQSRAGDRLFELIVCRSILY